MALWQRYGRWRLLHDPTFLTAPGGSALTPGGQGELACSVAPLARGRYLDAPSTRGEPRSARSLLDDLGGLEQHMLGDGEPESLGGPEVDDELEAHRPLHRQVGGLRSLQDLVHESRGA